MYIIYLFVFLMPSYCERVQISLVLLVIALAVVVGTTVAYALITKKRNSIDNVPVNDRVCGILPIPAELRRLARERESMEEDKARRQVADAKKAARFEEMNTLKEERRIGRRNYRLDREDALEALKAREIRRQRRERNRWIIIATLFFAVVFATATLVYLKRKDPDGKSLIDFEKVKRFFIGEQTGGNTAGAVADKGAEAVQKEAVPQTADDGGEVQA